MYIYIYNHIYICIYIYICILYKWENRGGIWPMDDGPSWPIQFWISSSPPVFMHILFKQWGQKHQRKFRLWWPRGNMQNIRRSLKTKVWNGELTYCWSNVLTCMRIIWHHCTIPKSSKTRFHYTLSCFFFLFPENTAFRVNQTFSPLLWEISETKYDLEKSTIHSWFSHQSSMWLPQATNIIGSSFCP